jgi:hypothetical protein
MYKQKKSNNKLNNYIYSLIHPNGEDISRIPINCNYQSIIIRKSWYNIIPTTVGGDNNIQWSPQAYSTSGGTNFYIGNSNYNPDSGTNAYITTSKPDPDNTNVIPPTVPIRLISACMIIHSTRQGNPIYNGMYLATITKLKTSTGSSVPILGNINTAIQSSTSKTFNIQENPTITLRYIPDDQNYFNYWPSNLNLGDDSNTLSGISNPVRFSVTFLSASEETNNFYVYCYQNFEALISNDYLYPIKINSNLNFDSIKSKFLELDKYKITATDVNNELLEKFKFNLKIKDRKHYTKYFFNCNSGIHKNLRLPSFGNEKTYLFKQKITINVNTHSSGNNSFLFLPFHLVTSGQPATFPTNYHFGGNGGNTPPTGLSSYNDFTFGSDVSNYFKAIRFVLGNLEFRYTSRVDINSGQFFVGMTTDYFNDTSNTVQTTYNDRFTFQYLRKLPITKTFESNQGFKLLVLPTYSTNFNFYDVNSLELANEYENNHCFIYVISTGLPPSTSNCIQIQFTRYFEALPDIQYERYFASERSKINFSDYDYIVNELQSKNLILTDLLTKYY